MAVTQAQETAILKVVSGLFNAAPGKDYLTEMANLIEDGMTIRELADFLAAHTFFVDDMMGGKITTDAQVAVLMENFGVVADSNDPQSAGSQAQAYFAQQIDAGVGFGQIVYDAVTYLSVSPAVEFTAAATLLANKALVAASYSESTPSSDLNTLQEILSTVTGTSAYTEEDVAAILDGSTTTPPPATGTPSPTGEIFTLTTGMDTGTAFTGGSGNDTFIGLSQATAAAGTDTLTVADVIDGGDGTDTLNITTSADNTDVTDGALISNIEIVNIRSATAATTATLNASTIAGVTQVNANVGAGAVTVTNLPTGASIGVVGNGAVLNGTTTYSYATATNAQVINISGGTVGGAITSSNGTATSVTINSTGANNVVGTIDPVTGTQVTSLTINAATGLEATLNAAYAVTSALTITGAGAVTLGGMSTAAFKTITSTSSGALDLGDIGTVATTYIGGSGADTLTLNTAITSVNTGAGDDVLTTSVVATTTAGAIAAGNGTDTLIIAAAGDVNSPTKRAVYDGFEKLDNATASALAANGFSGITSVISSADGGGFTGLTASQAAAVTVTADQTAVTYALATATGTSDVLSVTLKNATASASADLAGATVTGFETLNLTSSSGNVNETNAAANVISFTTAANLENINVGGAFATYLILDNTASAVTVANTLSGTAALKIEGEVIKGSSITTTANGDTIETALAAVAGVSGDYLTYDAGAGDDSITTSLTALNNTNTNAASLKIGGGGGIDTLRFATADVSFVDSNFQFVTGVEQLSIASTTSLSMLTGGYFDTNFKASGVTITAAGITNGNSATLNASSFTGATTLALTSTSDGATTADNINVTTGSGADIVSVTASSWVGAAGAAGALNVNSGAGADTISVTTGTLLAVTGANAVNINAGTGADVITAVHVNSGSDLGNITYVIADGDSLAASRDKITGFDLGTAALFSDTLDLQGMPTVTANTAATNGTNSGTLLSHAITSGVITFSATDTYGTAVVVNEANLSSALSYVAGNITTAGDTVAFAYDSDSSGTADSTIVYQQGTLDTVVELVGVVGLSLTGTNATTVGLIDFA